MNKQYSTTHTIHVDIEFTETEKDIINIARKEPVGIYWEENTIKNPYTLDEIKMIQNTLKATIDNNIFTPIGTEQPVDVPKNGRLTKPAQKLLEQLTDVLKDWNYNETKT